MVVDDPLELSEVANARAFRVCRVAREGLEEPPADELLALGHRRANIGVTHSDDGVARDIRLEDEELPRSRFEERAKVRLACEA
jgi:hypothetical protein